MTRKQKKPRDPFALQAIKRKGGKHSKSKKKIKDWKKEFKEE